MSYRLEDVTPAVEREELPDRLLYRWTDEGAVEVRFRAGTAAELAETGLDALVEARRETAIRRHDGGREQDYTRYPKLHLHVEAPPDSGRFVRVGHAGAIMRWEDEPAVQNDTDLREEAEDLHQNGLAWAAHAMNLGELAGGMADEVRGGA